MKRKFLYSSIVFFLVILIGAVYYNQHRKTEEAELQRKLEARFDDVAYRVEPYLNERFTRLRHVVDCEMGLMKQAYSQDIYNYEQNFQYLYEQSGIGYQLRWDPKRDLIFYGYLYGILVNHTPKTREVEADAFYNLSLLGSIYWERFNLHNNYEAYMEKSYKVIDIIDNSLRVLRKYDKGQEFDKNTRNLGPRDFDLDKY